MAKKKEEQPPMTILEAKRAISLLSRLRIEREILAEKLAEIACRLNPKLKFLDESKEEK